MSILEFTKVVDEASIGRAGISVRVTDVITGEITEYPSFGAASCVVGIDNKGIKEKVESSKLYKKRFKFESVEG